MPRLALARRFRGAEDVVDALDRLTGRKPEPLTAAPVDPPPRALLELEEPATYPEAAGQALERLIPGLVEQLQERRLGARRLALTGYRLTAHRGRVGGHGDRQPRARASGSTARRQGGGAHPEFGFDAFALTAEWTEELGAAQNSLVEEPSGERDIARLVDRLTVKLGPVRCGGRRPRRAICRNGRAVGWPAVTLPCGERECSGAKVALATVLLDRPEAIAVIYATPEGMPRRFVWRRAVHDIARVEGPERIAPEWWRHPPRRGCAIIIASRTATAAATGSTAKG